MRRHRLAAFIGALAVCSTVFFAGGAAMAQTYPPGTSIPACTVGDATAGTVAIGQKVEFVLCGNFAPGAKVSVTVNGTTTPVTKTPVSGHVTVDIKVVSQTVLEVDDPTNVAAVCGTNKVTANGASNSGGIGTSSGTFIIQCATTATTEPGGLAFTGGNVLMALIVAALLIVLGALLVMFQRRRRQSF